MTDRHAYALSASPLSHGESLVLAFFALRWYPASSSDVQRNRATLVAGSLMGGLPLGDFFMASIMWLQKVVDKWAAWVFMVELKYALEGNDHKDWQRP